MPRHLHLDFETFSEIDLRDVGAYRYAFDPSTEILCAAMALGNEEPVVWADNMGPTRYAEMREHFSTLADPTVLIYCHNAMFEMAICQALLMKTWGIPCPDLSRFRCTMSLARRASLPAKLETLGAALGLQNTKDNRGKALIKKFSMVQLPKRYLRNNKEGKPVGSIRVPARRILSEDEPEAFAEFCEYCRQDVRAEQEVARRLAYFDEPINNANYSLDAVINARGVPVNLGALRHAQKLIDEETEIVSAKFRELTGFEVTQNARLLEWVNEKSLFKLDNLQAETVEDFLLQYENKDYSIDAREVQALRLKQSIAYAAIKKVKTMLECAGPHDSRIRGMKNHHGASTGRDTNSLVQFQNMRRATTKWSEDFYQDICAGEFLEMLKINYGPFMENMASAIRHFVDDVSAADPML